MKIKKKGKRKEIREQFLKIYEALDLGECALEYILQQLVIQCGEENFLAIY